LVGVATFWPSAGVISMTEMAELEPEAAPEAAPEPEPEPEAEP
jgi:hypothetical protein